VQRAAGAGVSYYGEPTATTPLMRGRSGQATGGTGLGFAIPSSTVKRFLSAARDGSTPQHAYLGVGIAGTSSGNGAQLGTVVPGGPAADAGLKAGDLITRIGATRVTNGDDLAAAISALAPGVKVTVKVTRNGSSHDVRVTLGKQPAQATS
jgi:putative serine protease PepD